MRKMSLISVSLLLAAIHPTHGQSGPVTCKIIYGYDLSGNRIHREKQCEAGWTPADPMPENGLLTSLHPNPTYGPITGLFRQTISEGDVNVYTLTGTSILQYHISQPVSFFTIDISSATPGCYFVTIEALGRTETYPVIKL
jgi:hypothetical protein